MPPPAALHHTKHCIYLLCGSGCLDAVCHQHFIATTPHSHYQIQKLVSSSLLINFIKYHCLHPMITLIWSKVCRNLTITPTCGSSLNIFHIVVKTQLCRMSLYNMWWHNCTVFTGSKRPQKTPELFTSSSHHLRRFLRSGESWFYLQSLLCFTHPSLFWGSSERREEVFQHRSSVMRHVAWLAL